MKALTGLPPHLWGPEAQAQNLGTSVSPGPCSQPPELKNKLPTLPTPFPNTFLQAAARTRLLGYITTQPSWAGDRAKLQAPDTELAEHTVVSRDGTQRAGKTPLVHIKTERLHTWGRESKLSSPGHPFLWQKLVPVDEVVTAPGQIAYAKGFLIRFATGQTRGTLQGTRGKRVGTLPLLGRAFSGVSPKEWVSRGFLVRGEAQETLTICGEPGRWFLAGRVSFQ